MQELVSIYHINFRKKYAAADRIIENLKDTKDAIASINENVVDGA